MAWIVPGCWNWRGMRAGVGELTFWRMYTGCPLGSVYMACTMGAVMFVGVLATVGGEVETETEGCEGRGSSLLLWLQTDSSALSSCEMHMKDRGREGREEGKGQREGERKEKGEREGGRERGREGGREGGRERGGEGEREGGREGGRGRRALS